MLALKRNPSRPKKSYKDTSAQQANYMRERQRARLEANRLKYDERRLSADGSVSVDNTREELLAANQKAFVERITKQLYQQRDKNFEHLLHLQRCKQLELLTWVPSKVKKSKFVSKEEITNRYTGIDSIRGFTHLTRGTSKTVVTSKVRGQGKGHLIFGEIKYLKNVKERFWSFLSRNKDSSFSQVLDICKHFMNEVLMGTHFEINYINKSSNFLYWILKTNVFLMALREFVSIVSKFKIYFYELIDKGLGFWLHNKSLILTPLFFSKYNLLKMTDIIEYKKKAYISFIVLKLIYSLNINILSSLKSHKTYKNNINSYYIKFISEMGKKSKVKTIPGHFSIPYFTSFNKETQYSTIIGQANNEFSIKPEITFLFNNNGFLTKQVVDPLNFPNMTRFLFSYFSFASLQTQMTNLFNVRSNISNKMLGDFYWTKHVSSSKKFRVYCYRDVSYLLGQVPLYKFIMSGLITIFYNFYITKYNKNLLDVDNIPGFYIPVINDGVKLLSCSKVSMVLNLLIFIKKKAKKFIRNTEERLFIISEILQNISSEGVTLAKMILLKKISEDTILWMKDKYVVLFSQFLVGKDIFFPFILPDFGQIQASVFPKKRIYVGTRRRLSGMYTTSIREAYKKDNVLFLKQLIKAITTGGGRTKSVSILYKMLKRFKAMHDNYDISAIVALEKCVVFCSPRLRVKKFIKGTSKLYKFMPMRFSKRISMGVYNFVGASFLRSTFRKTRKKFHFTLAAELASIFIGVMTDQWTAVERFHLQYTSGESMDVLSDDMIPPALDIVEDNRQLLTYLRYYPTRVKGHVLINSPYLEYIDRKKMVKDDDELER